MTRPRTRSPLVNWYELGDRRRARRQRAAAREKELQRLQGADVRGDRGEQLPLPVEPEAER